MKNNYNLGIIELRDNRLYLKHCARGFWQEIDITPVWNFFNEVKEFQNNPLPPDDETIIN